jgi:hypothetical protein
MSESKMKKNLFYQQVSMPNTLNVPDEIEKKTSILGTPPCGFVSRSGLRYYVRPQFRSISIRLRLGNPEMLLNEIRSAYKNAPMAQDVYLIRLQADRLFRLEQWLKYKSYAGNDHVELFRRGMVLLYRAFEWRVIADKDTLKAILINAEQDLQSAWQKSPDIMKGAALIDIYGFVPNLKVFADKSVPFTEEFLNFVDPDYSYPQFVKARNEGFAIEFAWNPNKIVKERRYPVCGIIGERWSLMGGKSSEDSQVKLLEKWMKSLR